MVFLKKFKARHLFSLKVPSVLLLGVLMFSYGCSTEQEHYTRAEVSGVKICELKGVDTFNKLELSKTVRNLNHRKIEKLYDPQKVVWKLTDINVSRCKTKNDQLYSEALRVYIPKDKWTDGYQLSYDLYFDSEDNLTAIEARHRYIDVY